MIKIGMMIGERYEVLEKIGTGGMSDVYKAKCHKLNRFVAIKVLKPEFSENENFVSKFRSEAQSAAGLMHPNIVNVYDVGDENGIHYIVMELVEGITLKKYIEKKAGLNYREAVSIAIQVSQGIAAAHNNNIIHRDIKPQNIIISKEGKVKVTDFGIAKAVTSNTNTIASNVMGSVHYTSPEQARGGYSDVKSDIYSLGITLYEMLTGRVPFNGETTVAIAIKHIQEPMPDPVLIAPDVPIGVSGIVLKCCEKSPDKRYQNMNEVINDLKQALITPDVDFVVSYDENNQDGTKSVTRKELEHIKQNTAAIPAYEEEPEEEDYLYEEEEEQAYEPEYTAPQMKLKKQVMDDDPYEDDFDDDTKFEKMSTIAAIIGGVLVFIIFVFMLSQLFGGKKKTEPVSSEESTFSPIVTEESPSPEATDAVADETVTIPEFKNTLFSKASATLNTMGLVVDLESKEDAEVEENIVISTNPVAGSNVKKGTHVTIIYSVGSSAIVVPNVCGQTFEQAKTTLTELGFVVMREEKNSETVSIGCICEQSLSGDGTVKANKGDTITITVSLGKADTSVAVPNVIGKSLNDATSLITSAGLKVGVVTEAYNSSYGQGAVTSQNYAGGAKVNQGTSIDLYVSKGPEPPKEKLYKFEGSIVAPGEGNGSGDAEARGQYIAGTPVNVVLAASDGTTLFSSQYTSFPVSGVSVSNIKVETGTISLTYTYSVSSSVMNEAGEVIANTEEKSQTIVRNVTFTQIQ